jgi:isopenicillin N synthase-like dioxygenase
MIQVPVIDLTLARAGGRADRERVARQMDAACQEIGFFAITGHGVPDGRAVHSPVLSGEYRDLKYAKTGLSAAATGVPWA